MSERIDIKTLCGPACVDATEGLEVASRIKTAFSKGSSVHLDFSGVTVLTTSFMCQAVGVLRECSTLAELNEKLSVSGLDVTDMELYRLVMLGADRFYSSKATT